nr:coiled-coil domain-containing protein 124 like [Quercus suber]
MAGKKAAGENTKKAAGNAKKAEAAAQKQATEDAKKAKAEGEKWAQGSKDNSKAEAAAAKAAEAARKKAEKDALLAEEEASLPSKPTKGNKAPAKKSRGLDLSGLDAPSSKKELAALNATGIDNALDALDLTGGNSDKIDRHPERRFKAAYTVFEERRLDEMKDEKGLRRQQKIDQIRKEFEKHPDNPFNQVAASYNMSKEEIAALKESEKAKKEELLTGK